MYWNFLFSIFELNRFWNKEINATVLCCIAFNSNKIYFHVVVVGRARCSFFPDFFFCKPLFIGFFFSSIFRLFIDFNALYKINRVKKIKNKMNEDEIVNDELLMKVYYICSLFFKQKRTKFNEQIYFNESTQHLHWKSFYFFNGFFLWAP